MADDIGLLTIAARHNEDDVWFKAGHHDPNGYIGMAHTDRGELLKYLVPRQCKADGVVSRETITIPKAAYDWLMGQGPDDNGTRFVYSDGLEDYDHSWWRTTFRRMCGL